MGKTFFQGGAVVAALCAAVPAFAQTGYPDKPIRMIVPFSPGGTSDTLARILGQKLNESWGQQVVVDSRPGASGIIGTEIAKRAAADGYTLMHGNISQFAINPFIFNKIPYETLRDFEPLSLVATAPQLLVVNPAVPVKTVRELIDLARAKPGALNFGSGGVGTLAFIGGEMFKSATGVNLMHISYKGTVLALNDVMGGQVQALFSDMPIALPHAKTGKLRALAVTGPKRSPLVQGMPTVAEAGVAGYALVNWWGILAPRGLPPAVAEKLAREIARVHTQAEITERYAGLGVEAAGSTAAEFTEYIKAEEVRFAKVLKETGVKLD